MRLNTGTMGSDGVFRDRSSSTLERRCFVALLFADLSDYTAFGELADPEEVGELRERVEAVARQIILQHGGEINQFVGDGMMAVFGLSTPDEAPARHALEASLDLHEALRRAEWKAPGPRGFDVRFHSGVHSGVVFAKSGGPLSGKYELTGDCVNTAARLCSAARRDEVLVSEVALRGFESFFEVEPIPPLALKGKQHPVHCLRVKGRSRVQTRFEARSLSRVTPFVGRDAVLTTIERRLAEAAYSSPRALCVLGDAGIGKTRLFDELARRAAASGHVVRRGSCENYGGVVPLRPFLQIAHDILPVAAGNSPDDALRDISGRLARIDPGLTAYLSAFGHLLGIRPWSIANHRETPVVVISALTQLLLALARDQSTLLILDDWQWSDSGSGQVLGTLLRAQGHVPLFVLIGARAIGAENPMLGQVDTLELPPLSEHESQLVIEYLGSRAIDGAAAQRLHARAGGNALFLEELCGVLLPELQAQGASGPDEVPTTLQGLIHARIERLAAEPAELLRVASVIGNECSRSMLRELTSEAEFEPALAELVSAGLLYSEGEAIRFKHGLTREVTYGSVRLHQRRNMHARIASLIGERFGASGLAEYYEVLAAHYAGATDHVRAVQFADLAGDKAMLASALDSAATQYAAALAQLDQLSIETERKRRWLELAGKWARVCVFRPAPAQLPLLARGVSYAESLGDPRALAYAEYWVGWLQYTLGSQDVALHHLERALGFAEQAGDTLLVSQLHMNVGQSRAAAGNFVLALAALDRGIELRRQQPPGTWPAGFSYALGCRALVLGDSGDFIAAYAQIEEGFALVRGTGNPVEGSLLGLLGMLQLWQGRWQEALQTATQGRATAERVNGPYVNAMCRLLRGYALWAIERSANGLAELCSAVDWLDLHEIRLFGSFGLSYAADALVDAGQPERATAYADRALERARHADPIGEAMAERTLARLALQAGHAERARERCRRALELAAARGSGRERALGEWRLGELELQLSESAVAVPLLQRAACAFERMGMERHLVQVRSLLDGQRTDVVANTSGA
jgi:class 3 adenylate cyclase/tetratricopeptide (TPR) repeat protein